MVLLAEWVWSSFHRGRVITDEQRVMEAAKMLRRCVFFFKSAIADGLSTARV